SQCDQGAARLGGRASDPAGGRGPPVRTLASSRSSIFSGRMDVTREADPLPCIILLDLMMPVMDGQTFRMAQLSDPRIAHIPIVVISAYRDIQDAERLKATRFVKKPPKLD